MGVNCCKNNNFCQEPRQKKPKTKVAKRQRNTQILAEDSSNYTTIQMINANRLKILLNVNSPYNINNKYTHHFKLNHDETVNTGILQTMKFISLIEQEKVEKEIELFWETRVEGDQSIWKAIRQVVECTDTIQQQKLIKQYKLFLVDKSIQLVIDTKGFRYEVPVYCINKPSNYSIKQKVYFKFEQSLIKITMRSSLANQNVEIEVDNTENTEYLKKQFKEIQTVDEQDIVRIFYNGCEMADEQQIGGYGIKDKDCVTVLVRKTQ